MWSIGEYLSNKRQKLEQLQQHDKSTLSNLFQGLCFYINGYIPYQDFKELAIAHGGIVKDYLSSSTTHIIATQVKCSIQAFIR